MGAIDFGGLAARVAALIGAGATCSSAFAGFRLSFFGELAAPTDALDYAALAALSGRERRRAERMLADALPGARAIAGLAALATPRARARLAALFEAERARLIGDPRANGGALIAAAAALWRFSPHERYARAVIGRLRGAASVHERADAAIALGRMPTAEADRALSEALDDSDALVRHYAARALLEIHGVVIDARAAHCMVYRVMASEAERRARGCADVAAAISDRPLRSGAR
jgi:HEAT repeat protein